MFPSARLRSGFVHSRVSTAVASLRDRGWVVTSVDDADRRRTIVAVTERVRRGTAQARARTAEPVLSQLLHDLPIRRRAELIDAIKDLHRALAPSAQDHRSSR
jgi:DNA-binding MarR family transcriptional regulator